MEIRKLTNPWSDDIMALVQALPLCWSVHDEMHIKPVDLVRNNDFENPEIGVTYRKDLFVNVTHWRYTSQVDLYRKEFFDDLAAARRACFLPALAAPYKAENTIHRFPGETLSEKWDRICNDLEAHMPGPWVKAHRFDGSHLKKGFVKAEPITISLDRIDVRTQWAKQEAARQAAMKENAAKEVLGAEYETVVKNMKEGVPPKEAMTAEQISKIKAEFARLDAVFAAEATERWGGRHG